LSSLTTSFISESTVAGSLDPIAVPLRTLREPVMNSAAPTPVPETSATAMPSFSSWSFTTSKKSPAISPVGSSIACSW